MNKIININNLSNVKERKIFVDANIFMFVDSVVDYNGRTTKYSDAYFKLRDNNQLFTNEMIISEYCNRAFKYNFEVQLLDDSSLKFKKFRESSDGKEALSTIFDSVNHFLTDVQLLSVKDCYPDIMKIMNEILSGKIDITDSVIANICLERKFLVMSDDSDLFCKSDLEVITGNPWMIRNAKMREKYTI